LGKPKTDQSGGKISNRGNVLRLVTGPHWKIPEGLQGVSTVSCKKGPQKKNAQNSSSILQVDEGGPEKANGKQGITADAENRGVVCQKHRTGGEGVGLRKRFAVSAVRETAGTRRGVQGDDQSIHKGGTRGDVTKAFQQEKKRPRE